MEKNHSGLKILFTNAFIASWSGSELYVRDVAVELIRRGHKPFVFSPRLGALALDFRAKSIPVLEDLAALDEEPDLIHGQHHLETMIACSRFPSTPVVYFCHGWLPWEELIPIHPRILHYVTVSDALHDRLVFEFGIPEEKITTIYNFVDLEKFHPRLPLPDTPKRALVFDNHVSESNYLGLIRNACAIYGISLDAIGYQSGNPSYSPEFELGNYDIIFARGRAALEGLASGVAVICCSAEGTGEMVTSQNLDWMRHNNFGIRVMTHPMTVEKISAELRRYNANDAAIASLVVRDVAGLNQAIDHIITVYQDVLNQWAEHCPLDPNEEARAYSTYLQGLGQHFTEVNFDRYELQEKKGKLQAELDDIHQRNFWKVYTRIAQISWLRGIYLLLVSPIRHRYAKRKNYKNPTLLPPG